MNQHLSASAREAESESEVIVLGIGGHAKVIISTLQALNFRVVEAYDDDPALWETQVLGVPVRGPLAAIGQETRPVVIGFGDNALRQRVAATLPLNWLAVVHPSAVVHHSVSIGPGTVVFAGAVIQPDARVGAHAIINTSASVDHDCVIGNFAHVSPGVRLAGSVRVGEGAFLGIGSVAIPHTKIGAWTTVGAGGVVVCDLPDRIVAAGVPARVMRDQEPSATPTEYSRPEYSRPTPILSLSSTPQNENLGEFITPDDPRWSRMLQGVAHDFYHLPDYVRLEAEQSRARAAAFYMERGESRFLAPLLLHPAPNYGDTDEILYYDASGPYGYSSPLLHPANDASALDYFLDAFREAGIRNGIITAFARLHPLLPLPTAPLEKHGQLMRHGQTVYSDLTASDQELKTGIGSNHRDNIKKLRKKNFEIRMNEWQWYPHFIASYAATMERLQAEERYCFDELYFHQLREFLGERMDLGVVLSPEGEFAAGGIFITTGEITQCHLLGTADAHHRASPSKLLLELAPLWAKSRGSKVFHLGGGVGGREDSLFLFKAGFCRERADFFTFRMILDQQKYHALIKQWQEAADFEDDGSDDFFPPYRTPLDRRRAERRHAERREQFQRGHAEQTTHSQSNAHSNA